jgi:putative N6-adenine-specific DNA methylase
MPHDAFATTAPGLEPLLLAELTELGFEVGAIEPGGVPFVATTEGVARALLWLRTANRVTVRLGEFRARTFAELERHAAAVDWAAVLTPGVPVHFRVTSKKSKLYHQDAIAERLERVAQAAVPGLDAVRRAGDAEELEDDVTVLPEVQRIVVRVARDSVTLSADAAGALLHRRGYRLDTAKAPLRETLAAGMLLGVGWHGNEPLLDPLAGSGTLPIEAALIARRMAPGRLRRFAAERWPAFGTVAFELTRRQAAEQELPRAPAPIIGRDRDPGAVLASITNAERAGVILDVSLSRGVVRDLPADTGTGLVITNPPYGARIGERNALRDLYAALGIALRERLPHWRFAMLSADRILQGQVGVKMTEVWRSTNGGIPIKLVQSS